MFQGASPTFQSVLGFFRRCGHNRLWSGLCGVALAEPEAAEAFVKVINAKLGAQLTSDDVSALGVRVLQAELDFNRKAGFTNEDDRLAEFFYKEPLPPHNTVFSISDEEMDTTFDF